MEEKIVINKLSKDKILKKVILQIPFPNISKGEDVYFDLLKSITSQQLSTKAAQTIFGRFTNLFDEYPYPKAVKYLSIEQCRAVGLSGQKAGYVQNVAHFFDSEEMVNRDWHKDTDEEIIKSLTQIKGVGLWTAQMILMFTLGRSDVFPIDDLGIQLSMRKLYKMEEGNKRLFKDQMQQIAAQWRPYRSIASIYLWNWRDIP